MPAESEASAGIDICSMICGLIYMSFVNTYD